MNIPTLGDPARLPMPDARKSDYSAASRDRKSGLSCAECRRSKLKCDRSFPCQSCIRRGCAAICPDGTLAATKGNKVLMAHAQQLTEQVKTMTARIKVLEQALSEAQADNSAPHPLLRDAGGQDPFKEISDLESKYESDLENVTVDIGSLSIGMDGRARYYGETAGSEYLQNLISQDYDQPTRKIRDPKYLGLPYEILELVHSFPFGLRECPHTKYEFTNFIPPRERAEQVAELYYTHAAWMYNVVPRADLKRTILDPIYGVGNNDISLASVHSHRISLFFMVLATGIFYDDHPSASIMAEQYSALAYAAYSLDSISQEATTASVQAMFSMCFFVYLTDRSNNEMRWLLSGLAARVALVIGLQRDSSGWNLDKEEVQRRRVMFWELYHWDAWSSVVSGRPPALNLGHTDCRFPDDIDPYIKPNGEVEMSWHSWKARYGAVILSASVQRAFAIHGSNYASLLELDKRIRTFPVPTHLQSPNESAEPGRGWNADPSRAMQQFCILCERESNLLYIHRSYLAQAMRESPTDPLGHRFSASVMAAYRSSCRLISALRSCYTAYPKMTGRVWFFWSGVFSACVVLGAIVIESPGCTLAQSALTDIDSARTFYDEGSKLCRPPLTLATLDKLQERAHRVFSEFHAKLRLGDPTPSARTQSTSDQPDELEVLGGRKSVINRSPSTSPNSSSAASPATQPNLSNVVHNSPRDVPIMDHIHHPPVPPPARVPATMQQPVGRDYVTANLGNSYTSWGGYYDSVDTGQQQQVQSMSMGQASGRQNYDMTSFARDPQVQEGALEASYAPPPIPPHSLPSMSQETSIVNQGPVMDQSVYVPMTSAQGYLSYDMPSVPQTQQPQYAPQTYSYASDHQHTQMEGVRMHPSAGGQPGFIGAGGVPLQGEQSQVQIWYDFVQGLGVTDASNSECVT